MNSNISHGVLIPSLNKDDLILKPEVEEAVKAGQFHIYTMDTLDDAIDLMMLDDQTTIEDFFNTINVEVLKYKKK